MNKINTQVHFRDPRDCCRILLWLQRKLDASAIGNEGLQIQVSYRTIVLFDCFGNLVAHPYSHGYGVLDNANSLHWRALELKRRLPKCTE